MNHADREDAEYQRITSAPCGVPGCKFQQRHRHVRGFFGLGRRYMRLDRADLWPPPRPRASLARRVAVTVWHRERLEAGQS